MQNKVTHINKSSPFYAADLNQQPLRFLHSSGKKLTDNKDFVWFGTEKQFEKICEYNEWDALSLVPRLNMRS